MKRRPHPVEKPGSGQTALLPRPNATSAGPRPPDIDASYEASPAKEARLLFGLSLAIAVVAAAAAVLWSVLSPAFAGLTLVAVWATLLIVLVGLAILLILALR